jgi:hypothetical protein
MRSSKPWQSHTVMNLFLGDFSFVVFVEAVFALFWSKAKEYYRNMAEKKKKT